MHCDLNETSGSSVLLFLEASECNWLESTEVRLVSLSFRATYKASLPNPQLFSIEIHNLHTDRHLSLV